MPLNLRGNHWQRTNPLSFETCLDFLSTTWTFLFGHALYHPHQVHSLLSKMYVEVFSFSFLIVLDLRSGVLALNHGQLSFKPHDAGACAHVKDTRSTNLTLGGSIIKSWIMNQYESCVDQITATICYNAGVPESFSSISPCHLRSPSSGPWYWCHSRCQNRPGSCACLDIKQPS